MKFKIGDKVFINNGKQKLESYFSIVNQRVEYATLVPYCEGKRFNYTYVGFTGVIIAPYTYPHDFNLKKELYYDWNVKLFVPHNIVVSMCEDQLDFANDFQIRSTFKRKPQVFYYR